MSWKENLQPASFRGVKFFVESASYAGGRRNALHEYPLRDKPYVEDVGRAARKISINAFILGTNFIAEHKKLIGALEQKGSGTLIHPFYGEMTVSLDGNFTVNLSTSDGGMAKITMPFIESGELTFPTSKSDTVSKTRLSADSLSGAARSLFANKFSLNDMPDFVRESAIGKLTDVASTISSTLRSLTPGISGLSTGFLSNLRSMIDDPFGLASAVGGLFDAVKSVVDTPEKAGKVAQTLVGISDKSGSASEPVKPLFNTPAREQEAKNENAIDELVRNEALSNAAGAATIMPPVVYDDVTEVRDQICDALDKEALYAPPETYESIQQLRIDVYKDMTDRASDSARLKEYTPTQTTPALVIAYDLYETAERADEIIERNKILNPAFVPPAPIKVLTQ